MKRILFIASGRVEPGQGSGERSLSIHRALSRLGQVDVVVVPPRGVTYEPRPGENIVVLPGPPSASSRWYWRKRTYLLADFRPEAPLARAVERMHRENRYDVFVGRYQLPVLGGCARLGPSFIDLDDLPIDTSRALLPLMRTVQRRAMNRSLRDFAGVFVTKRADMAKVDHPRIELLPCISTQPPSDGDVACEADGPRLLFVGGLYWAANREGVIRFIDRSLPRVRERVPGATLRLVGANGEHAGGRPGVDVAGFVPDIAAEYRRAAVTICPIRRGAGSVVKLAEAAGFGQAIVATPYAAAGYESILEPGRDLLVAESDEDFADRVAEILTDAARRDALRRAALSAARTNLSQSAIDAIVERTVGGAL